MTVRKYRSAAEMPDVRPRTPLDPENIRIACDLSELGFALRPLRLEPGVRKFRSQDAANRHRAARERLHVQHHA
jgi:hypothetical protein